MTYIGTGPAADLETANASGTLPSFEAAPAIITPPGTSTSNGVVTWNGTSATSLLSLSSPIVNSSGVMTNSNQPCFLVSLTSPISTAWGDGATYTVICNNTIFDQNSDYSTSTGIFTAPSTGKYLFSSYVSLGNTGSAGSTATLYLTATSRTFILESLAFLTHTPNNYINPTGNAIVDMTAGDTATIQIGGSTAAGSKTGTFFGAAGNPIYTWICGVLLS